ncbi:bifunctional fucokinase/fucose pyrophosphorylase-like, partial [Trifolium medium]|nr:bifunctional fucokinase/fucose pyrophosphorylase-like [Trifolium medium]
MKVTKPLLDGVCIEVPKVLAHEPQHVHPWSYWSDLFHVGCSSVLANIHRYFGGSARVRRFDVVSKTGGVRHTIGEVLYEHLIFQRFEAKEVGFYAPDILLFLLVIFGSIFWIMNLGNEESQSLYLLVLDSSVGTHELVKINDGKNMEVPNIYRQIDSYYEVLTTSFFQVAKLCASHLDASLDKEKGDNRVYHGNYFFSVTSTNLVAVMVGTRQEWLRKYPLSEDLVTALGRQRKFNYYIYALMCLHLEISNGVFNHLIGISKVAIQMFLNHKFK